MSSEAVDFRLLLRNLRQGDMSFLRRLLRQEGIVAAAGLPASRAVSPAGAAERKTGKESVVNGKKTNKVKWDSKCHIS